MDARYMDDRLDDVVLLVAEYLEKDERTVEEFVEEAVSEKIIRERAAKVGIIEMLAEAAQLSGLLVFGSVGGYSVTFRKEKRS